MPIPAPQIATIFMRRPPSPGRRRGAEDAAHLVGRRRRARAAPTIRVVEDVGELGDRLQVVLGVRRPRARSRPHRVVVRMPEIDRLGEGHDREAVGEHLGTGPRVRERQARRDDDVGPCSSIMRIISSAYSAARAPERARRRPPAHRGAPVGGVASARRRRRAAGAATSFRRVSRQLGAASKPPRCARRVPRGHRAGRNAASAAFSWKREVVQVVAEGVDEQRELAGQGRARSSGGCRCSRSPESELVQHVEGVIGQSSPQAANAPVCRFDLGLHSSGDPAVLHPLGQTAERPRSSSSSSRSSVDVLGDAHAVAEAQRAAVDEGAADAVEPVRLARVHGDREALLREVVERSGAARAGSPSSGPAMSKPTTPRSRWRRASSAISCPRSGWRIAVTSWPTRMSWPGVAASSMPPRCRPARPRRPRRASGRAQVLLGRPADLAVDDAVGGEVLDELRATRSRPSRVCMTEIVMSKVFRYSTSVPLSDCSANQSASASASVAGSSMPSASASSMIVWGRSPPSRWSCSETFGRLPDAGTPSRAGIAMLVMRHVRSLSAEAAAWMRSSGSLRDGRGVSGDRSIDERRSPGRRRSRSPGALEGVQRAGEASGRRRRVNSGWPARTVSPGFACRSMPAACCTGSSSGAAGTQPPGGDTEGQRVLLDEDAVAVRRHDVRSPWRRAARHPGRRPARGSSRARSPSPGRRQRPLDVGVGMPGEVEHLAGERDGELDDVGGSAAGEHLDRLAHLVGVADREPERHVHVGQQRAGRDAGVVAEGDHRPGELARARRGPA